jgi:hypothetical protein
MAGGLFVVVGSGFFVDGRRKLVHDEAWPAVPSEPTTHQTAASTFTSCSEISPGRGC